MSHISYYAPLDEQLAESIRVKYRLLRSRRLKAADFHAVSQAADGDFRASREANYNDEEDHKPNHNEGYRANCMANHIGCWPGEYVISVHRLERNAHHVRRSAERYSGNRSEYRKRHSTNRNAHHKAPLGHTYNASTNLICESSVLLAYLATLLSSLFILNCTLNANRILLPIVNYSHYLQTQYKALTNHLARKSSKIYRRSTAKLFAFLGLKRIRLFCYWMPFACLVVGFELNDLHFAFLKNLDGFLVLYALIFPLPMFISYCRAFSWRTAPYKTLLYIRINKMVSLTLLCIVDYVLVRNCSRALQSVRELNIAYLVESFVDNLVNFDQPKFNYLPEDENLSADKLNVLRFLTVFSLLRLTHSLVRLLLMESDCLEVRMRRNNEDCFNHKDFCKRTNHRKPENDYKSKLRSYQKKMAEEMAEETIKESVSSRSHQNPVQMRNSFEDRLESSDFFFTAVRPILLTWLSYSSLFTGKLFCHTFTASLVLVLLFICLLVLLWVDLKNRNSLILTFDWQSVPLTSFFQSGQVGSRSNAKLVKQTDFIRLLNHFLLQNLLDLVLILCIFIFIGSSIILWLIFIAQLLIFYFKYF